MYGVNLIKIITVKQILDHAYVCMDPLQLIQEKKTVRKILLQSIDSIDCTSNMKKASGESD